MNKNLSLWDKLIASFDNTPDGFSARKLSAFTAIVVALIATFRFADQAVIVNTLMVWLAFALLCMGIITAEQILKFYKKDGENAAPTQEPKEGEKGESEDPKL
jgi:hypothetical protein